MKSFISGLLIAGLLFVGGYIGYQKLIDNGFCCVKSEGKVEKTMSDAKEYFMGKEEKFSVNFGDTIITIYMNR